MDDLSQLLLLLVLIGEVALIAIVLGGIGWWLYRRKAREARAFSSEKTYLAHRREAYLRYLTQRLSDREFRRRRAGGKEAAPDKLARRFLEEEKRHTEAARDRDAEIWDLRMASTQALIDLFADVAHSGMPNRDTADASPQEPGNEALRRKLVEREQTLSRLRQDVQELTPFRDAWMRLHRQASKESEANATLRSTLRATSADPATAAQIESALQAYAGEREVLDDYLAATAGSYEEAHPEQVRRERQQQRHMDRVQNVVDTASSRIDTASQQMPQLMEDQRHAIADLEKKLERAKQAREVIKHNYSRDIQKLKKSNHEATENARSLEKENRRLRMRVRNLINLTREKENAFIPPAHTGSKQPSNEELQAKQAEVDTLAQQLRQEKAKAEELQQQLRKFRELEAAIQTTLHTGS